MPHRGRVHPISAAPQPDLALAAALFEDLARATRHGRGIVRDSYGAGEQVAHDIARRAATATGLQIACDAIGNLLMTLPGRDRAAPCIIIGSHLDSVPQGGNFDGAAGVIAGLSVAAGLRRAGIVPPCDITVMAIRAEESAWFDVAYLGSTGAFGLLDPACLDVVRSDNGRTLAATLIDQGFDPEAIRARRRLLDPVGIRAFLELHIEQGPVLLEEGVPAAVVTGIRGCQRFRQARCLGDYAHSGAVPRAYRQDAVAATVALLHQMDAEWQRQLDEGADLVVTTGELFTDPVLHGPSKIAGETCFVLDLRSLSDATMDAMVAAARHHAEQVGGEYRVRFNLGRTTYSPPARMDMRLRAALLQHLAVPFEIASGAGHDAAVFASLGIPTAMLFVRNANGSHNPDEAMAMEDFAVATQALAALVLEFPP